MASPRLRDRVVRYGADPDLAPEDVAARISAYVYGNIIIFATLLAITPEAATHLHAFGIVVGATVTTFVAHLYADSVGHRAAGDGEAFSWRHELRDSLPILSSAVVPCVMLLASAAGIVPGLAALIVADVYLLLRIASIGLVIERLRFDRTSTRGLLGGLGLALGAALVALAKYAFGH